MTREPMTCVLCWETRGTNVKLEWPESVGFDNRSVETKFALRCPLCGHTTGVLAT